jgi:hypothetical protein
VINIHDFCRARDIPMREAEDVKDFKAGQLKRVTCPKGWMNPEGYRR